MRTGARGGISLTARGGSGSGTLGSVAAPAVALPDIPSVCLLHVRFNGLRAKPLRGGCSRRDGDGDVRVRDRQMDAAEKRSRGRRRVAPASQLGILHMKKRTHDAPSTALPSKSALQGRTAWPRMCALISVSDPEQRLLAGMAPHELQPDGQARWREATGN